MKQKQPSMFTPAPSVPRRIRIRWYLLPSVITGSLGVLLAVGSLVPMLVNFSSGLMHSAVPPVRESMIVWSTYGSGLVLMFASALFWRRRWFVGFMTAVVGVSAAVVLDNL